MVRRIRNLIREGMPGSFFFQTVEREIINSGVTPKPTRLRDSTARIATTRNATRKRKFEKQSGNTRK
jgi:hypothetical protein